MSFSIRIIAPTLLVLGLVSGCGIGDAQDRLRTAVDAQRDSLEACYTDALVRNEQTSGSVQAWLKVDQTSGQIEEVEVTESQLADGELQMCMTGVLREVRMSEPPPAPIEVAYTFEFTPRN